MFLNLFVILSVLHIPWVFSNSYTVNISSDSPIVRGATIHFVATLYEYGNLASGDFVYIWNDNSMREHIASHKSSLPVDTWNVTYTVPENPPGPYEVQVIVQKCFIFCYTLTSKRETFELTEMLNGKLDVLQNKRHIENSVISNTLPVTFQVDLNDADALYINSTATSILVYWFVDCTYYGVTTNFTFTQKYAEIDKKHIVEALIIAGYEPNTTPAPLTTTVTPITTTLFPNSTTKASNITTAKPTLTTKSTTLAPMTSSHKNNEALSIPSANIGSHVTPTTSIKKKRSISNVKSSVSSVFPYVCSSNNSVAPDVNKTYGYFSAKFIAKAPVSNISVTGNYWLPKGEILDLKVKCLGSPPFSYCKHYFDGTYNITGNETCDVPTPDTSDECQFPITHYFMTTDKHTVVIVIYNSVGKIVSPVTVTVYKVQKQAQLSVIVVPVSFCLVAVVLIVFGVAYYAQNRSRYTVEVADFDFGQQGNELEYKTFKERLYDSIINAFTRAPTPGSSEPTVWPPGQKYGSLT